MATLHVPFTGREMGCALLLALPPAADSCVGHNH
jgi:hypothetical protein